MSKIGSFSSKALEEILSENLLSCLDKKARYEYENSNALNLVTHNRFDVVAKYIYAKSLKDGVGSTFSRDVYEEHIKAFNGFYEADGSGKIGKDGFNNSFINLLSSIASSGFDSSKIVPVSRDGVLLDGAHRVASALVHNVAVPVVKLDLESPNYNFEFFENRGLDRSYLDYIALTYARLKTNTRVVCMWGSAKGKDSELAEIISSHSDVVYRKDIVLSKCGALNMVRLCYSREPWLGNLADGFVGAKNKAARCFEESLSIRVFVVEPKLDPVLMKEEIRSLYGVGKHSVHINDSHEETIEIAEAVFNENSLKILNLQQSVLFPRFEEYFQQFVGWIVANHFKSEEFCVDGSGTLAVLGVRDVNDLDVIAEADTSNVTVGVNVDVSDSKRKFHVASVEELLYDPSCHFYYKGIKFISLDVLSDLKRRRQSATDEEDLKLIEKLLQGLPVKMSFIESSKKWLKARYVFGRIKLLLLEVRYVVRKIWI